jgi:hypothetical protein
MINKRTTVIRKDKMFFKIIALVYMRLRTMEHYILVKAG